MSDKYFVDTNILVYAHDIGAGAKHERARTLVASLWEERSGILSTQVLQELCIVLRRKAKRPVHPRIVREIVTDYLAWDVHINTGQSILDALRIEERYELSFWDALILAAAASAGASVMYSEDLGDGQHYGDVRVVNPLK